MQLNVKFSCICTHQQKNKATKEGYILLADLPTPRPIKGEEGSYRDGTQGSCSATLPWRLSFQEWLGYKFEKQFRNNHYHLTAMDNEDTPTSKIPNTVTGGGAFSGEGGEGSPDDVCSLLRGEWVKGPTCWHTISFARPSPLGTPKTRTFWTNIMNTSG